MGLFGGYNNPGPGVSKNEPEKKAFFKFFELYFRKFWKLMVANLLYVLISLPIVTRGLAQVGLTYVTRQYSREKHVFLPSDFFDTIKKNWKQGLAFGLLELIVSIACGYSLYFYFMGVWTSAEMSFGTIIPLAVALFVTAMVTFTFYYVYLQIITFKMSFKQILKNSVLFAAGGVKQNLLLTLVQVAFTVIAVLAFWFFDHIALGILIPLYVLVYPAFRSFMIQFTVFPLVKKAIIDPYYEEHPDEDIEKRRDLNLEAEEPTAAAQEEPIFTDAPQRERETPVIPKQYGADELRRSKKLHGKSNADEDGTI
ncbi:MAG: YesL family protein [Clostridia bacterium]|nr:YesL family protein [Clostridia bacterium]